MTTKLTRLPSISRTWIATCLDTCVVRGQCEDDGCSRRTSLWRGSDSRQRSFSHVILRCAQILCRVACGVSGKLSIRAHNNICDQSPSECGHSETSKLETEAGSMLFESVSGRGVVNGVFPRHVNELVSHISQKNHTVAHHKSSFTSLSCSVRRGPT